MNNMADFDQLIKDKVEKAEYTYKPSAWKGFAKRAGIKAGLSGVQIALLTISLVTVISGVTLGVLFLGHPTTNEGQGMGDMVQDTVETRHDMVLPQENEESAPAEPEKVKPPVPSSKIQKVNDHQPAVNSVQPETNSQKQTATGQQPTVNTRRPIYGPPIELNVDTITQMVPTDEQLRNGNSRIF